jgi:hypothetical protein
MLGVATVLSTYKPWGRLTWHWPEWSRAASARAAIEPDAPRSSS